MTDKTNATPHNIDAEQAFLGSCLFDGGVLGWSLDHITADAFYDPVHARVYENAVTLFRAGTEADAITLGEFMEGDGGLKKLGGKAYLAELMAGHASSLAARDYARFIVDLYRRREAMRIGLEVEYEVLKDRDRPATEIIGEHAEALAKLVEAGAPATHFLSTEGAMADAIEDIARTYSGEDGVAIPTGLGDLDRILGGIKPGRLTMIAGRPGMGKSLFGMHVARVASDLRSNDGRRGVLYFTLEMPAGDMAKRMLSTESGIAYADLDAGEIDPHEFEAVRSAAQAMVGRHAITFDERGTVTTSMLRAAIRREQQRRAPSHHPLRLVVIDHVGLIRAEGHSAYDRMNQRADDLLAIAKDFNLAVVVLAQLNREVERREDKHPTLADLRDSGKLEENAHSVLTLFRPAYYAERQTPITDPDKAAEERLRRDTLARADLDIEVLKNRGGRIGRVTVFCDVATARFDRWGQHRALTAAKDVA